MYIYIHIYIYIYITGYEAIYSLCLCVGVGYVSCCCHRFHSSFGGFSLYCIPVCLPIVDNQGPDTIKNMSSYQYRKSHCGGKMAIRSSFLHNGNFYTGKMTSIYPINSQDGFQKHMGATHKLCKHTELFITYLWWSILCFLVYLVYITIDTIVYTPLV